MASADIKDFFRQKKKGGVSKKPSSGTASKKKAAKGSVAAATAIAIAAALDADADAVHPPALVVRGEFDLHDNNEKEEEKLRQFDMDMRYGPCIGLTRLERWERALSMGLRPPPEIRDVLLRFSDSNPALECLWEGRV